MAELQTEMSPVDGQISNDVAGSVRVVSQTTGGDIIVTDGKTMSVREGLVNVRDYGAVGDGATDDTQAFIDAIDAARSSRRTVFVPAGKYFLNSVPFDGLDMMRGYPNGEDNGYYPPDTDDMRIATKTSVGIRGESPTTTQLIWGEREQCSVLFRHAENFHVENLTITDIAHKNWKGAPHMWQYDRAGYKGIVFATPYNTQSFHCIYKNLNIFGAFLYSFYARVSIWDTYENIFTGGSLIHYCFACGSGGVTAARNAVTKDEKIKSFLRPYHFQGGWNGDYTAGGWFHNMVTMKMIHIEGGEVGIYGPLYGLTIENITCQNMIRSRARGNLSVLLPGDDNGVYVLGANDPAVGIFLRGQGIDGSESLSMNSINGYYIEIQQRALKLVNCGQLNLTGAGFFSIWNNEEGANQGKASMESFVYMNNSNMTVDGWKTQGDGGVKAGILDGSSNLIIHSAIGITRNNFTVNGSSNLVIGGVSIEKTLLDKVSTLETSLSSANATITSLTERIARLEPYVSVPEIAGRSNLILNLTPEELKTGVVGVGDAPMAATASTSGGAWVPTVDLKGVTQTTFGSAIEVAGETDDGFGYNATNGYIYTGKGSSLPDTNQLGFGLAGMGGLDTRSSWSVQGIIEVTNASSDWGAPMFLHDRASFYDSSDDSRNVKGSTTFRGIRFDFTTNAPFEAIANTGMGANGTVYTRDKNKRCGRNINTGQTASYIITCDGTNIMYYINYNVGACTDSTDETSRDGVAGKLTFPITNHTTFKWLGFCTNTALSLRIKTVRIWKDKCLTDGEIQQLPNFSVAVD